MSLYVALKGRAGRVRPIKYFRVINHTYPPGPSTVVLVVMSAFKVGPICGHMTLVLLDGMKLVRVLLFR